jgi:hypothetical protein
LKGHGFSRAVECSFAEGFSHSGDRALKQQTANSPRG